MFRSLSYFSSWSRWYWPAAAAQRPPLPHRPLSSLLRPKQWLHLPQPSRPLLLPLLSLPLNRLRLMQLKRLLSRSRWIPSITKRPCWPKW